jgi:hypothetical protein
MEMVSEALRVALTAPNDEEQRDYGELAGETVIGLAANRVIDSDYYDSYALALHHATLADILTAHLRPKGGSAWLVPPDRDEWQSKCYMAPDGMSLRRVILVRDWDEDRMRAECHSWFTLGEMAVYELPMTFYVMVLGQYRLGHRYSAWTRGYTHPRNQSLKFVKKSRKYNPLTDNWKQVWREDAANISRDKWLDTMQKDGILKDLAIVTNVALPPESRLEQVRRDIQRAELRMAGITETPPKTYSFCYFPFPCCFRRCCWGKVEKEPDEKGFVRVNQVVIIP